MLVRGLILYEKGAGFGDLVVDEDVAFRSGGFPWGIEKEEELSVSPLFSVFEEEEVRRFSLSLPFVFSFFTLGHELLLFLQTRERERERKNEKENERGLSGPIASEMALRRAICSWISMVMSLRLIILSEGDEGGGVLDMAFSVVCSWFLVCEESRNSPTTTKERRNNGHRKKRLCVGWLM